MLTSKPNHIRFTTWAVSGLEIGAVLFGAGLLALFHNPFWHFDDGGFLDWRVHWWNAGGEILTALGLLVEGLALVWLTAVLVSRLSQRKPWPYFAAGALVFGGLVWVGTAGFIASANAHFEWDAADGFTVFRLQLPDDAGAMMPNPENVLWKSIVEIQIEPLLRGYFSLNDWQKMNGDVGIRVARMIPVAWPVALGSGGETLEDPDETAVMRAAALEDLKALQQLLAAPAKPDVNALDQSGQTALIFACRNPKANPDVVKALLTAGADVNLRARNGYAPLTWALARNNSDIVRILRHAGARP
ncbi:MAG: ankyrin repeat domain-containing protein [Candidatus Sulfotelmatobacter sp.]